jgi:glycosyltransferase involved in cell wall biosynthesis
MEIISVILTTRNEEEYIKDCILSVSSFERPDGAEIELLIIDGKSEDNTIQIINELKQLDYRIKFLNNPFITQACGFNIGVKHSKGNYLMWLGAHSKYPKDYLLSAYNTIKRTKATYVGGILNTLPHNDSCTAQVVQALTTHSFGVGTSGFRTGRQVEGFCDTASYGIFNKKIFNKIGYLDERLIRAQDYEFNMRIIKSGGTIWLNPNMIADYFNQPNLFVFLKKQFYKEAPYNAYMWYLAPYTFTYRHAITGVFALGVLGGIILSPLFPVIKLIFLSVIAIYTVIALISSIQQAKRYNKPLHVLTLPISFFLYHFLHGLGVLGGLLRLATGTSPVQKIKEPWDGYGSFRIKIDEIIKRVDI